MYWPVDGRDERLAIEMSGLPVFDRDRQFDGFRGFGICRDVERLDRDLEQRAGAELRRAAGRAQAAKVVPFRAAATAAAPNRRRRSAPGEHSAFQELARELSDAAEEAVRPKATPRRRRTISVPSRYRARRTRSPVSAPPRAARNGDAARDASEGRPILDRLPIGILVYRLNNLIYANRAFLDWTGYSTLEALAEAGGLDSLFIETKSRPPPGRRQERRQDAHHHHRQRQAEAGRRPPVQRGRGTTKTRWC